MSDNLTRDLLWYYGAADEKSRLDTGVFQLELQRTERLLRRYLPPPPAVIADIGGGPGRYSLWLAALGYQAHLLDPVPKHIEQAHQASELQPEHPLASVQVGDARALPWADSSADAVLLLGPLYHLPERNERLVALREARRILRVGGVLFCAAISRYASLLDSLLNGWFGRPEAIPILDGDLRDGYHRNLTTNPNYFTTAFFHRPDELEAEVREARFSSVEMLAIEGAGWAARDFDRLWQDSALRERLMACIERTERDPSLLGMSAHIMAICRK